jgi:hypothetical protein
MTALAAMAMSVSSIMLFLPFERKGEIAAGVT